MFQIKQIQMYVCTLEEFILVDLYALLYKVEVISIGKYTGIYTITTMDDKCSWSSIDTLVLIELQLHEKLSLLDQDVWNVIPLFASCLTPYNVKWYHHWLLTSHIAGETTECWSGNLDLLMTRWENELILFLLIVSYCNIRVLSNPGFLQSYE